MWNEIQDKQKMLDKAIETFAQNGYDLAMKEKKYKIALNKRALELRSQDMPVTLINQIIYGVPEVAEKRYKRDIAETMYNTNQEHINATKLKLRLLEGQLSREWGNINNEN